MWHPEPLTSCPAAVSAHPAQPRDDDNTARPCVEGDPRSAAAESYPLGVRTAPTRFAVRQLELSFSFGSQGADDDQPLPRRFVRTPSFSCRRGAERSVSPPRKRSADVSNTPADSCESSEFGSGVWALGFEAGQGAVLVNHSSSAILLESTQPATLTTATAGLIGPLPDLPQMHDVFGASMGGSFSSPIVLDGSTGTGPSPRGDGVRIKVPSFRGIERVDIDERLVSNLTPASEQDNAESPMLVVPGVSSMVCVGPFP